MAFSVQLCDNGDKVQLCDGGAKVQLADCVPDSCPCASWPDPPTAGDFPCGGLAYQYEATNGYQSDYSGGDIIRCLEMYMSPASDCSGTPGEIHEVRLQAGTTFTAVSETHAYHTCAPSTTCIWEGDKMPQVRSSSDGGASWNEEGWVTLSDQYHCYPVIQLPEGAGERWQVWSGFRYGSFGILEKDVGSTPSGSYTAMGCFASIMGDPITYEKDSGATTVSEA